MKRTVPPELISALKPYVLDWVSGRTGATGGGTPTPHNLASSHHSGSIADYQGPQFALLNGSRAFTGALSINVAGAPFVLGAGAQGQLVIGLNADKLDGLDATAFASSGHGHAEYALVGHGHNDYALKATTITAGAGLTGGGDLSTHRTIAVGAGTGISVAADAVAIDQAFTPTWTGAHAFQATMTARDVLPELTDTYDLGSYQRFWRQSFISQLNSVVMAENTLTLLGGWFLVAKNQGTLPAVSSGQTQIDFGTPLTPNDFIKISSHDTGGVVKTEYMQIGSLVSGTTYNVTRDVGNLHGTDPAWPDGTPWVCLGYNGTGRIELNAYDTPRLSIVQQGTAYNAQTEVVRIGDLNGWGAFGAEQYGWAVGDYATGNYAHYSPGGGFVIRAGMGNLTLDGDGIAVDMGPDYELSRAYQLADQGTSFGGLGGYVDSQYRGIYLQHYQTAPNKDTYTVVRSHAASGRNATAGIYASTGTMGVADTFIKLTQGPGVGNEIRSAITGNTVQVLTGSGTELTHLWGDAGTTYTGLQVNVTDAGSAAGSKLLDLMVGAVSKFTVLKDGNISVGPTYTDWTPTVTQGVAVTITVNEAKYCIIGKVCHYYADISIKGPGTSGNDIVISGLPAAARPAWLGAIPVGPARMVDANPGTLYVGALIIISATTFKVSVDRMGQAGTNPNFALANGDDLRFSGTHRIG
jgi:hypothetical protein